MSQIVERLDDASHPRLVHLGFKRVRSRFRVTNTTGPIRKIFLMQVMKSLTYSAQWGFSIAFVPLLWSDHLRWKRTAKSTAFDLCVDPIDASGSVSEWCSFFHMQGYSQVSALKLDQVAQASVAAASIDFIRVQTLSDMITIFEECERMKFSRFPLENYRQTQTAWALCLMAIGKSADGERRIQSFCERFGIDRSDPKLLKSHAAALRICEA